MQKDYLHEQRTKFNQNMKEELLLELFYTIIRFIVDFVHVSKYTYPTS